ncbi:hypothetical protein D210916BOD24_32340 [Alteromonas sp. D210916BOD_24]|uniref:hypothetical protein n=1 Tax=Alteromonas sp. D210916BOD_24 TaxID=3157618 RepID=UPI00399C935E
MLIDNLAALIYENKIKEFKENLSIYSSPKLKAVLNTPDSCEDYIVHIAIKSKQAGLLQWLLERGAEEQNKNYWGNSALELATQLKYQDAIDIINQFKENINKNKDKLTLQPCANSIEADLQKQVDALKAKISAYESKPNQLLNTVISESVITCLCSISDCDISKFNIPDEIKKDSDIERRFESLVYDLKVLQEDVLRQITERLGSTPSDLNNKKIQVQVEEKRKCFIGLNLHNIIKKIQDKYWVLEKYACNLFGIQISEERMPRTSSSEVHSEEIISITINNTTYYLEYLNVRKECWTPDDTYLSCHKTYTFKNEKKEPLSSITCPYEYDIRYGLEVDKEFEPCNITSFKNGDWIKDIKNIAQAIDYAESEEKRIEDEERASQRNAELEQLKQNFDL